MKFKAPYFFLGLAALLSIAAIILFIVRLNNEENPPITTEDSETEKITITPDRIESLQQEITPKADNSEDIKLALATANPAELLAQIVEAIEKGDFDTVSQLIGKESLDSESLANFSEFSRQQKLNSESPLITREIGEIELNKRSRWAIEHTPNGSNAGKILFDLRRENGLWKIEKVTFPEKNIDPTTRTVVADPLDLADKFVQSVLNQNFEAANELVDQKVISEAKIAALCILFEEGEYKMRTSKPLRAIFSRDGFVGYLANVESVDGEQNAQFGIYVHQTSKTAGWLVTEINLDDLLAGYAKRFADGDVYYSPLVKNPAGGETLALYFEFDEDQMSSRTSRQLEIVASMLKSDPVKKITLSGHTDALGSKNYNNELSEKRADVVRDFLAASGVSKEQIVTIAKGASQPRRPNLTESGADNPEGRRANRRTEIYLDF